MLTIDTKDTICCGNNSATFSAVGAELQSFVLNGVERIWTGDERFWKRRAPILFPIVGGLNRGTYTYQGKRYEMPKHGFARDSLFERVELTESSVHYSLLTERENYPFPGKLDIIYQLTESGLSASFRVMNLGDSTMLFSLGWHPALVFSAESMSAENHRIQFGLTKSKNELKYRLFNSDSLIDDKFYTMELENDGMLITDSTFDKDVLIVEAEDIRSAGVWSDDGKCFVNLHFSSPLLGLWAPKGGAPFICIEPWYGSDDISGFVGDFSIKSGINRLKSGCSFEKQFLINSE